MGIISLKVAFQLRSFLSGDFAGGGVISPGFNGVAGLGIDGASGGGSGAGSLSLQAANVILKPKRVTADSDTISFIVFTSFVEKCRNPRFRISTVVRAVLYLLDLTIK
jgi:hypothetical protein